MTHSYPDRQSAGRDLARALCRTTLPPAPLVLALPRGGVPVAYEVAHRLHAPLDVLVVRKIGMPGQSELAIGAIAQGDIVVNDSKTMPFGVSERAFQQVLQRERSELARREHVYRAGQPALDLRGRSVILVDDGLATGDTMLAAVRAARAAGASYILVAAPVGSVEAEARLDREADKVFLLRTPAQFYAVGQWYQQFEQLEDADVTALLSRSRSELEQVNPPA